MERESVYMRGKVAAVTSLDGNLNTSLLHENLSVKMFSLLCRESRHPYPAMCRLEQVWPGKRKEGKNVVMSPDFAQSEPL